jgi:2-polyprenyl-3-methyl-5-hydroxy-6-metoxy-1,4-benzoquinol methylase
MWHVLEHVHRLSETMSAIGRVIKPDGTVFIAVPNYTSLDASHYGAAWAAYDVPRHLYHFSPESMQVLLSRHGFTLNRILPMWYDSFYVSMLSERYRQGNIFSALLTGIRSNINALRDRSRCSSLIYVAKRT